MEFFKHEKSIGNNKKNPTRFTDSKFLFLIPHLNDIQDLSGHDGVQWAMSERDTYISLGKLGKASTPEVPEKKVEIYIDI